ncbi:MAG: cobyric acid synthase [Haloarculaceae archaeon]
MTRTILVAGTASHVGKSTVVAGLCRHLAEAGVDVVPFKAQNMSNNARAVPCPTRDVDPGDREGAAWGEIGVSQSVQAAAAGVPATTDLNPVLLKPTGDASSQLLVQGRPVADVGVGEYFDDHWKLARKAAAASYRRLAAAHEVVVAEGAGSVAEPNLRDRDLANVETARFADPAIVLLADVDRGGAFASVVGSLELASAAVVDRVEAIVLTKFRGDRSLLEPAIEEVEERTGVPVRGVIPHEDPGLPEEDSVSLPGRDERAIRGADDGVGPAKSVTVGVPRLPRLSNATDLEPLAREPGVRVAFLPMDAALGEIDALVVPGTKNTVDDLLALREAGFGVALRAFDGPTVGICGGYQMLGRALHEAHRESTVAEIPERDRWRAQSDGPPHPGTIHGVGLLPVETTFHREKRVRRVTRQIHGTGPLAGASGTVEGYEIHAGRTEHLAATPRPVGPESAVRGQILGTYLHDLFANECVRTAFLATVFEAASVTGPDAAAVEPDPYGAAADLVETHTDLARLDELPEVASP